MGKTLFSDGNPLQGILGTIVNSLWLNKVFNHRHDGLDQDGSAPLDYAPDTGSANAYAIALSPALTAHIAGMPIHFKATNANTGASTLAVNALAAVAIKQVDDSGLPAGSIVAGQMVTVIYTGAAYMLVSGRGLATDTEVQAGTDTSKIVTSERLYNALGSLAIKAGFACTLGTSGYVKFPSWLGGVIFQWGVIPSVPVGGGLYTLPITWPHTGFSAVATHQGGGSAGSYITAANLGTNSVYLNHGYNTPLTIQWIAVGY